MINAYVLYMLYHFNEMAETFFVMFQRIYLSLIHTHLHMVPDALQTGRDAELSLKQADDLARRMLSAGDQRVRPLVDLIQLLRPAEPVPELLEPLSRLPLVHLGKVRRDLLPVHLYLDASLL